MLPELIKRQNWVPSVPTFGGNGEKNVNKNLLPTGLAIPPRPTARELRLPTGKGPPVQPDIT